MQTTKYKDYRIDYHMAKEWFVHIYPPKSPRALGGPQITASVEEGESVLLSRARARVDEEITKESKPPK